MRRPTKAFTLIELLAALAISGMLIVAALTVASDLGRSEARAQVRHKDTWLHAPIRAVVSLDLLNAAGWNQTEHGYLLRTQSSLAPGSMELRHLPATVEYTLQALDGHTWLTRTQHSLTAEPDVTDLVCSGVQYFGLETNTDPDGAPAVTATVEFDAPEREPLIWVVRPQ